MQSKNVFKFLPYKEEIKRKVVVSFRKDTLFDEEDVESYFVLALEKWGKNNSCEAFTTFKKNVIPLSSSLKLLLHHQAEIIEELYILFQNLDTFSVSPCLDLLSNLICDVGADFYSCAAKFLPLIVSILDTHHQNADIMNDVFCCLTHMVYFLRKPIMIDLESFLTLFVPLLNHKKTSIPEFAADCIAFLIRKLPNSPEILRIIAKTCTDDKSGGLLLTAVMKSPEEGLHSLSSELIPFTIKVICHISTENSCPQSDKRIIRGPNAILKKSRLSISSTESKLSNGYSNSFDSEFIQFIHNSFLNSIRLLFFSNKIDLSTARFLINSIQSSLSDVMDIYSGRHLSELVSILVESLDCLKRFPHYIQQLETLFGQILSTIVAVHSSPELLKRCTAFILTTSPRYNPFNLVRSDLLPNLTAFLSQMIDSAADQQTGDSVPSLSSFLIQLRFRRLPLSEPCPLLMMTPSSRIINEVPILLNLDFSNNTVHHHQHRNGKRESADNKADMIVAKLLGELTSAVNISSLTSSQALLLSYVLPHIRPLDITQVHSILLQASQHLVRLLSTTLDDPISIAPIDLLTALLGLIEARFLMFSGAISEHNKLAFDEIKWKKLIIMASRQSNPSLACLCLRIADLVLCCRALAPNRSSITDDNNGANDDSIVGNLLILLESSSHQVRLHSLRILALLNGAQPGREPTGSSDVLTTLTYCLQAERTHIDFQSSRQFLGHILHLQSHRACLRNCLIAQKIALHHMLGLLHLQMTAVWSGLQDALASYSEPQSWTPPASSSDQPSVDGNAKPTPDELRAWKRRTVDLFWSILEPSLIKASQLADADADHDSSNDPPPSNDLLQLIQWHFTVYPDLAQLPCQPYNQLIVASTLPPRKPVDWVGYRLALWRSIRPQAVGVGKASRLLTPLVFEAHSNVLRKGYSKSSEELLLTILGLFSKLDSIKSIYREKEFKTLLMNLLTERRPSIQAAALQCLLAYKSPLRNYRDQLNQLVDMKTFRETVRTFKLDTSFTGDASQARLAVAPVLLRILFGRVQMQKGDLASAVFTNLASSDDSELGLFISLLLQPLFDLSSETDDDPASLPLSDLLDRVDDRHRTGLISWSRLHAMSNLLNHLLDYMAHRLGLMPTDDGQKPPTAIELTFVSATTSDPHRLHHLLLRIGIVLLSLALNATSCSPGQLKAVRRAACRLISRVLLTHPSSDEVVDSTAVGCLRRVCLAAPVLSSSSWNSTHWLLQLADVWSHSSHQIDQLLAGPLLDSLARMLASSSSTPPTKSLDALHCRVVQLFDNLVSFPDIQEVGRRVLAPHINSLITYFHNRLLQLARHKSIKLASASSNNQLHPGAAPRRRDLRVDLHLLNYLASQVNTASQADQLLNGLLTLLTRSSIKLQRGHHRHLKRLVSEDQRELTAASTDQAEADLVRSIVDLLKVSDTVEEHLTRILQLFAKLDSRICRSLLCQAVGQATNRLSPDWPSLDNDDLLSFPHLRRFLSTGSNSLNLESLTEQVLVKLNSWFVNRIDEPDFNQREHAFQVLTETISLLPIDSSTTKCRQLFYLHLGGLACALHTLSTADLQLRDSALDYCQSLFKRIGALSNDRQYYRPLVLHLTLPHLLRVLRLSDKLNLGPKRLHLIRLFSTLVRSFSHQSYFAPLALLAASTTDVDFYRNIESATLARQSTALRRLHLFLANPLTLVSKTQLDQVKSLNNSDSSSFILPDRQLRDFFLPLLRFYLDPLLRVDVAHTSLHVEHKKLIDNCLDALGSLARRLAWPSYRSLLDWAISSLASLVNTQLATRVVVLLIDAFQSPPCVDDNEQSIHTYMVDVVDRLKPHLVPKHSFNNSSTTNTPTVSSLKVPLVVSLVTLLKRLPADYLNSRLANLVLSVIDVLRPTSPLSTPKSRLEAVKSLCRVARLLGPGRSLDLALKLISSHLTRGYAAKQIRLFTLHRIMADLELHLIQTNSSTTSCLLDQSCLLIANLYFDELVGSLAEEMDSRRSASRPLTSHHHHDTNSSTKQLTGSSGLDLPEAGSLKAPDGLARLCRLVSPSEGLPALFALFESSLTSAATGRALVDHLDEDKKKLDDPAIGCGLRFRGRALARLEAAFARLPTRTGLFAHTRRCEADSSSTPHVTRLIIQWLSTHVPRLIVVDHFSSSTIYSPNTSSRDNQGWKRPNSKLLEPRRDYLGIDKEPKRDPDPVSNQSAVTQYHLLVSLALNLLVGLIRFKWLQPITNQDHLHLLIECMPSLVASLETNYMRVLGTSLRCLNLLFMLPIDTSTFTCYLTKASHRLLDLLTLHPGLLSTKTASTDTHARMFGANLYKALAALVRYQTNFTLSSQQLGTLLNAVDIDLTCDAATTPSLSLLLAILQRRLRDSSLDDSQQPAEFIGMTLDSQVDQLARGLRRASATSDKDFESAGAGGGTRLVDIVSRLQHLAIASPCEQVRAEARCCLVTYLLNYPHQASYLHSFLSFCLRQLDYAKPTGRLSVVSLLTGLVSDLPVSRLTANHMDELILLHVGAAIERESVRSIRVGLLALVRQLFARLPSNLVELHWSNYIIAFLTASDRPSARLLGLQLTSSLLDCHSMLSIDRLRSSLLRLANDLLTSASRQLQSLLATNSRLQSVGGLESLFSSTFSSQSDQFKTSEVADQEAKWLAKLKLPSNQNDNTALIDVDATLSDADDIDGSDENQDDGSEDNSSNTDDDIDYQDNDNDLEHRPMMSFEQAESDARQVCDQFVPSDAKSDGASKQQSISVLASAIDLQYFILACTLELCLRLIHRLACSSPQKADTSSTFTHIDLMTPIWSTILTGWNQPSSSDSSPNMIEARAQLAKCYASLFTNGNNTAAPELTKSLLCAGHPAVREWACRCLTGLLRFEVDANDNRRVDALLFKPKSAFFRSLKRKQRNGVINQLIDACLFQFEFDGQTQNLGEEWANSLITNLVHLAQLAHLSLGAKPVLRLLRSVNRIDLDELNNRPRCFVQRNLAVKLTTALLLKLPRPVDLSILVLQLQQQQTSSDPVTTTTDTTYLRYLQTASRLLAREFRQRERLAFTAASIGCSSTSNSQESARQRLAGLRLSREQSTRAKARRRQAQARLRRSLMTGSLSANKTLELMAAANESSSSLLTGPDQLVTLIESSESALTQALGSSELIKLVCAESTKRARVKRLTSQSNKASRDARGMAWVGPTTTEKERAVNKRLSVNENGPQVKKKRRIS